MHLASSRLPLDIVITGPDGSGKSTTCRMVTKALAALLPNEVVREVALWDFLSQPGPFADKEAVIAHAASLSGQARTLFIFQMYAQAMSMSQGTTIRILNGHWFKYAVSELGYGVPRATVLGAAAGFTPVDETFFLAIDPSEAWRRRERASVYEQGAIAGARREWLSEPERFFVFQRHLGRFWKEMAHLQGPWRVLDSTYDKQGRADAIVARVLDLHRAKAA